MRPCHFFPRREGVLGNDNLVVFLYVSPMYNLLQ